MNNGRNTDGGALSDLLEAVENLVNKYDDGEKQQAETLKHLTETREKMAPLSHRMEAATQRLEAALDRFPETVEVKIRHRFEGRKRVFAFVFMASLTVASVTTGLWFGTWRENIRLADSDLKYRYQLLTQPRITQHTDTLYHRDPAGFRRMVAQMEAREAAIRRAEAAARTAGEEAQKARENVERLKGEPVP